MKTWLFWDCWHLEHQDNVQLCQGRPERIPEAVYQDPTFDYLGMWPTVYRDEAAGLWRMLYIATGFPLSLMMAESEDGIHWRPADCADVQPPDEKRAPNHLFSVPGANGGPIYLDPVAADGRPFKFCCVQRGGPVGERAELNPDSYFHEIVAGEGVKPWMAENLVVSSADGRHWQVDEAATWSLPNWHPDPPLCCFHDPVAGRHRMVTRPGWGDRRLAMLDSADARQWQDLRWLMQPDPSDPIGTQFYGMPVHRYEGTFVGFLWMAAFANAARLERFNQLWGAIDCQLAYSFDGEHWQRGPRQPFMPNESPGEPGAGVLYPTSMVERDGELWIYSAATPDLHHQYAQTQFLRKGTAPPSSIVAHRLRRDGFMYLAAKGHYASFITKPLILQAPELRVNVQAPHGDLAAQLTDLCSRPLPGFTFADCRPIGCADGLELPLEWRGDLATLLGRPLRLEVTFRHARLHAVRGDFHFADALDVARTEDTRPIDPTLMDW